VTRQPRSEGKIEPDAILRHFPFSYEQDSAAASQEVRFPAFLNLLQSRMYVYEEVIAYMIPFSAAFLMTLIRFVHRAKFSNWTVLWPAAGLGGFVRPL
jgi:hypothetical protein